MPKELESLKASCTIPVLGEVARTNNLMSEPVIPMTVPDLIALGAVAHWTVPGIVDGMRTENSERVDSSVLVGHRKNPTSEVGSGTAFEEVMY
jgi:hypothetical protein